MTSPKELEALLFSGDYDRVVEATARQNDPRTLPALVGALALSGRLDEAESAFRSMSAATTDELIQARFYVIAGLCHAGQVGKALRRARESVEDRGVAGAASRFWIWQGLALVRFFEGRFARSRRFARRALAAAVEASFPYARLLALDLLAHVLVETGEIHAGLRVLAQAEQLAQALGYASNRLTLHTARMVFQLRFLLLPLGAAVEQARVALADPAVSYFTRRNGLLELAMALALGGAAHKARAALLEAREIALPGSDRRGRTRFAIAHALLAALAQGAEAAAPSLEEAWSTAGEQLTLAAEIAFVEVFFARPTESTGERLPNIARASGVARAQLAAAVLAGGALPAASRIEDRLSRILVGCHGASAAARLEQILEAELLGLVPWALGLSPGRRVIVCQHHIISEDHGAVALRPAPGGPSLRLLSALREGYQSRENLVSSVWRLGRYDSLRHSGVINTAVSRLRLALAEPAWIITHEGGYELQSGVEIHEVSAPAVAQAPAAATRPPSDDDRVIDHLSREGEATTGDVARVLGISASSALRSLHRLESLGEVERVGRGRSTRYRLRK